MTVAAILVGLADELKVNQGKLPEDVALEAFNLAAAFIDADGTPHRRRAVGLHRRLRRPLRHGGPGRQPDRAAGRRPAHRASARSSTRPSPLFDLLVRADASGRTGNSWRYYLAAARHRHAVFAIDDDPVPRRADRRRAVPLHAAAGHGQGRRPPSRPAPPPRPEAAVGRWGGGGGGQAAPSRPRPRSRPVPSRSCWPSSTAWSAWRR